MNGHAKRVRVRDRNAHLLDQADRARKLALESSSPLVAELYELHASLCEQEAKCRPQIPNLRVGGSSRGRHPTPLASPEAAKQRRETGAGTR